MSKKTEALAYDVRARLQAEAERDLALATLEALKKDLAAAPPAAPVVAPAAVAPVVDVLKEARAQYRALKESNPYQAAEYLLNHGAAVAVRE